LEGAVISLLTRFYFLVFFLVPVLVPDVSWSAEPVETVQVEDELVQPTQAEEKKTYRYSDVEKVVVIGDIHGAHQSLVKVLKKSGLLDEDAKWAGGKTHLVSLGDLLDRGAESRKIMDLLMSLQEQARAAGGRVHVLMGNHELMNMSADTEYVSAAEFSSYRDLETPEVREAEQLRYETLLPEQRTKTFDQKYPPGFFGHQLAMSETGAYGAWLRSLPYMIVINDMALVHGGLPQMVADLGLEGTNQKLDDMFRAYETSWNALVQAKGLEGYASYNEKFDIAMALPEEEGAGFLAAAHAELFSPDGPLWSREDSVCIPLTVEDILDAALTRLDVNRVVVGHTVTPDNLITTRFEGRVVMVDTGMLSSVYQGGRGSALVVEGGNLSAIYEDHDLSSAVLEMPRRVGDRPGGLTDDELEQFLMTAKIVKVSDVGHGVTHPLRVDLEKDGIALSAVFKDVNFKEVRKGRRIEAMGDRWNHEVAAYGLDRLLDLRLVPVTVPRVVDGKEGSLQYWVDGLVNQIDMQEQGLAPGDWCSRVSQHELLRVFDALIYNQDRTQQNHTYDPRYWRMVLIDHSRSFETSNNFPESIRKSPHLVVRPAVAKRLATLTENNVKIATRGYLKPVQVRKILVRRDKLLKSYQAADQ